MSYILDALRKSDQQRNRGASPTLFSAQEAAAARKRPAFVLYGLLAIVLIGAGIAIGVMRPWQPQAETHTPVVVQPAAPAPPVRESTPAQQNSQDSAQAVSPALPLEAAPPSKPEPTPLARVKRPADLPRKPAASVTPKAPPEAAVQMETVPTDAAEPLPVISMAELPASIRGEIPQLKFTVHAYAVKPASRILGIDNRILREGDTVAPGVKLEEITPDGMVLSYKGYRFSRGVN